jgi:AcrR family transcriptional regulator
MGVYERQQKEKQIVQSAIRLFSTKGYHSTKMDEVAKQAKISKGLIYFYFKNKEDLYMAVTKKAFDELKDIFKDTHKAKDKKGIDLVMDLFHNLIKFASEKKMFYEAILNFMGIMNLYNDKTMKDKIDPLIMESANFQKILEIQHESAKIGIQMISMGIEDGSMRADLHPESTFYTVWAMIIGYEKLRGPIDYDVKDIKISLESSKNGLLKLLYIMLKGSIQGHKPKAVQGSLF